MAHRISPSAERDLLQIWHYVIEQTGSLRKADQLIRGMVDTIAKLSKRPLAGRRRDDLSPGFRSFVSGKYVTLYRIAGGNAEILRVSRAGRRLDDLIR
jgi:toxin ParE1/3/4